MAHHYSYAALGCLFNTGDVGSNPSRYIEEIWTGSEITAISRLSMCAHTYNKIVFAPKWLCECSFVCMIQVYCSLSAVKNNVTRPFCTKTVSLNMLKINSVYGCLNEILLKNSFGNALACCSQCCTVCRINSLGQGHICGGASQGSEWEFVEHEGQLSYGQEQQEVMGEVSMCHNNMLVLQATHGGSHHTMLCFYLNSSNHWN